MEISVPESEATVPNINVTVEQPSQPEPGNLESRIAALESSQSENSEKLNKLLEMSQANLELQTQDLLQQAEPEPEPEPEPEMEPETDVLELSPASNSETEPQPENAAQKRHRWI